MDSTKVGAANVVAVAVGLTIAALAYVATQGITAGPSTEGAAEAEAAIARTKLASRLEAALGNDFGGLWFEPSTAQLHVGVTSPVSRQAAEGVAGQAGLEDTVVETPVRSTWVELQFAQERWSHRLADLFDKAEVATSLAPDHNSLEVELGSEVSRARRASLEDSAAIDPVSVSISTAPRPSLEVVTEARCEKFVSGKAHCEPTIVAGVSFEGLLKKRCTTGLSAITTDRSEPKKATETYVLTAGHCIAAAGGNNKTWEAFNKNETKKLDLGASVAHLVKDVDAGAVAIHETSIWKAEKDPIPVAPTIAIWDPAKETDPIPVIQQENPVLGVKSCMSGQTSGTSCGPIVHLSRQVNINGNIVKDLVEVKETLHAPGDSGAPWFTETRYTEQPSTGYAEGIHVGGYGSNAVFQTLKVAFSALAGQQFISLELLTESNKIRHPVFTAAKYPVTVSGKDTAAEDKFTIGGGTISCKETEFDGEITVPQTTEVKNELQLAPTYKVCTDNSGQPVKVSANGCKYKLSLSEKFAKDHYKATWGVVCPDGQPGIQFSVYADHAAMTSGASSLCVVTIVPQSGLKTATLKNSGESIVIDKGTMEGITMGIFRHGCECLGGTTSEITTGVYHIGKALTLSGTKGAEKIKVDLAGG